VTGIVGRNDYGKSTILEALAIFFESGDVKAGKSDMNCFSLAKGAAQFEIACDGLPAVWGVAGISGALVVGRLGIPIAYSLI